VFGVIFLAPIDAVGEALRPFIAIIWFHLTQSGIDPYEKADYFSALFDSPVIKAYACAICAVVMSVLFGALSGAEKRLFPNIIFSILAGAYVAFTVQDMATGFMLGLIVFLLCLVGSLTAHALRIMRVNREGQSTRIKEESFEDKVQKIRDKQRLSRRASVVAKPALLAEDHTD
jgi:hypothetical protein